MNRNNEVRSDDLGIGGFSLLQPKKGYRFAIDAPLLGALLPLAPGDKVLDLGCGSGVLPLLLLGRERDLHVSGVEIREKAFALAKENMARNGVFAELVLGDAMEAAEIFKGQNFDLVISNPPYYPVSACRLPQDEDIAAAKTELFWDQRTMLQQAFALLKREGCFALIFDRTRDEEMLSLAEETGFYLHRRVNICGKESGEKHRVYFEFRKTAAERVDFSSLTIYDTEGQLTPKMKRILEIYDGTGTVPCGDSHR